MVQPNHSFKPTSPAHDLETMAGALAAQYDEIIHLIENDGGYADLWAASQMIVTCSDDEFISNQDVQEHRNLAVLIYQKISNGSMWKDKGVVEAARESLDELVA